MRKLISEKPIYKAIFNSENDLMAALNLLIEKGIKPVDIISPYPINHPVVKENNFSKKAGKISFWSGVAGLLFGLGFPILVHLDLPITFGEKPLIPWISLVLPAFLGCVLFASLGLLIAFVISSRLVPGQQNKIYHPSATEDRFILLLDLDKNLKSLVEPLAESIEKEVYIKQEIGLIIPIKTEAT